ncbi:unnamed protein product, partial [Discosporangium mesarthrocarpum]
MLCVALLDLLGLWKALLVCIGVLFAWLWVFDHYLKERMPQHQQ